MSIDKVLEAKLADSFQKVAEAQTARDEAEAKLHSIDREAKAYSDCVYALDWLKTTTYRHGDPKAIQRVIESLQARYVNDELRKP